MKRRSYPTTPKPERSGKSGQRVEWVKGELGQGKCRNCGAEFPKTRPDREFCKPKCRLQFWNNRGSYSLILHQLPGLIEKEFSQSRAAIEEKMAARFDSSREELRRELFEELDRRLSKFRRAIRDFMRKPKRRATPRHRH